MDVCVCAILIVKDKNRIVGHLYIANPVRYRYAFYNQLLNMFSIKTHSRELASLRSVQAGKKAGHGGRSCYHSLEKKIPSFRENLGVCSKEFQQIG